jgi:citrate synthase
MESTNRPSLLSARDTADRLGIKLDTLYAYVSRGLLRSVTVPGLPQRGYRTEDVERFRASRGQRRDNGGLPEALVPVIGSSICLIEAGRLYYRGEDAVRLAETATLEDTADLLWGDHRAGSEAGRNSLARQSSLPRIQGRVGERARQPLSLIERCQLRLAMLAADDLAALDLTRAGVIRTGRKILAALVAAVGDDRGSTEPAHTRLASFWQLDDAGANLLRRCLVLLADHELNASTFVARCVASTAATPYAVVSAALSALSGRRHGGASARAEALLHEIGVTGNPIAIMAARIARDEPLPGLGQPLYPEGDPRARALFAATIDALPSARAWIENASAAARRLSGEHPNVDFALATVTTVLDLPAGAALSLFVVGRSVGWIAHAIEQYESGVLIRPRARYTGPRPVEL